ncbi:hypothetical protein FK268_22030 [Tsukamurella sputi]|uniref:Uncharacterized protein n=1 Tax=Tsukamurella sputi TaxID=2591848 RepID=A0A5C5RG10_9ACTN|nr:hypothetical protein [Tsukamurella sputi]TWS22029.1 hypothetical protein FK268_22030 [Tsukamurella sputi]
MAAATPEKITTDAAKTIDTPTTGDKAFTEMPAADRAGTDAAKVPDTPTTGDKTFTLTPAADGAGRAIDGPSTGGTRPTDSSLLVPGSPIDPRFRTINGEIRSFLADGTHVNGDLFNPATWNAEKFSAPQLLRDSCLTEP